jgi:hypothetical protein
VDVDLPYLDRKGAVDGEGPTISAEGLVLMASWGNGLAPLVFANVVWLGPAPRLERSSSAVSDSLPVVSAQRRECREAPNHPAAKRRPVAQDLANPMCLGPPSDKAATSTLNSTVSPADVDLGREQF